MENEKIYIDNNYLIGDGSHLLLGFTQVDLTRRKSLKPKRLRND